MPLQRTPHSMSRYPSRRASCRSWRLLIHAASPPSVRRVDSARPPRTRRLRTRTALASRQSKPSRSSIGDPQAEPAVVHFLFCGSVRSRTRSRTPNASAGQRAMTGSRSPMTLASPKYPCDSTGRHRLCRHARRGADDPPPPQPSVTHRGGEQRKRVSRAHSAISDRRPCLRGNEGVDQIQGNTGRPRPNRQRRLVLPVGDPRLEYGHPREARRDKAAGPWVCVSSR